MKNKAKLTINVAQRVAPILGSRDVVHALKDEVAASSARHIELDFSTVDFISRSAAHELLSMADALKQNKIEVVFVNANPDVATMIRAIAANRILPRERHIEFTADLVDINTLHQAA